DYINFSKYGRLGLYVYVKARVQGRRFNENQLELKIVSIQLLPDVKDQVIEKITITLPIHEMNAQMVEELSTLTKNNVGNSLLYFEIVDGERNMKVELFARGLKINIRKELIDYLEENENIVFKVN
ncbi:MAG: DNA polymerase III subunit alpha, partial [Bacteroides sp.]|nr:DNA polymerase III subunit alpha [Bacteroides sp.]